MLQLPRLHTHSTPCRTSAALTREAGSWLDGFRNRVPTLQTVPSFLAAHQASALHLVQR